MDGLAEGVQDSAQHAVLVELRFEQLQGYVLGRPAPDSVLIRWLEAPEPA